MQVSVENTGTLGRKMTVQVPAEEITPQVETRLRQLSKQVKIKGFRPGRIPMNVIKQRYERQVRQEVISQVMQESLHKAIKDEDIRLAGNPRVDPKPESLKGGDLEYTAEFEIFPDLGDTDVTRLTINCPAAKVEAEDVDNMLLTLRRQRAQWSPSESKADTGDRLKLEYVAEAEEVRHPEMGKERIGLVLGANGLFEAFDDVLKGMAAGDTQTVSINFPDDFRVPALAGKAANTTIEMISVETTVLPEVDEEFARSFGIDSGDVAELREEIRKNLERELSSARTSLMKVEVTNKLLENRVDLEVPQAMIEQEAKALQQRTEERAKQSGVADPEPVPVEQFYDAARRRVTAGLLMGDIAHKNKLKLDQARVRESIETIASTFEQPQEVIDLYYGNPRLLENIESAVLEEQVVDWVIGQAQVNDEPMAFRDVITQAASYS